MGVRFRRLRFLVAAAHGSGGSLPAPIPDRPSSMPRSVPPGLSELAELHALERRLAALRITALGVRWVVPGGFAVIASLSLRRLGHLGAWSHLASMLLILLVVIVVLVRSAHRIREEISAVEAERDGLLDPFGSPGVPPATAPPAIRATGPGPGRGS